MKKWLVTGLVVVGMGLMVVWRVGVRGVGSEFQNKYELDTSRAADRRRKCSSEGTLPPSRAMGLDYFVSLLRDYQVVGGTISPKVGRDVVYEEGGDYVEKFQAADCRRNTSSGGSVPPSPEIFYPFAGMEDEEVSSMYHVASSMEGVGWVVVRASGFWPLASSLLSQKLETMGNRQTWPGVVLAKREEGKLKVKVVVGIPGVRVFGGDSPYRLRRHPSRDCTSGIPVRDCPQGERWLREPEWWEGEVEFKENKGKIDYVFLGKNWYDVSRAADRRRNTSFEGSVPPSRAMGKIDSEGWERVGYVSVGPDLSDSSHSARQRRDDKSGLESVPDLSSPVIEVRAARKSREKQGEVWTELVQSAKLKVQNDEGMLQGDEGDFQNRLRNTLFDKQKEVTNLILEVWYPIWEGNDLARRGNQEKAKNCDVLGRGRVETEVIKGPTRLSPAIGGMQTAEGSDPSGVGVDYKAEGYGVNCDYIPYNRYGGFENYFLIVKGENKEGRSLKIYLHSLEKDQRVILEELLPEGKFEKVFPIEVKKGGGMVLNLETRSFGRVASENVVEQVLLVPVEWGWVRRVKMINPDLSGSSHSARQRRDDKPALDSVAGLSKIGTGLYVVSLKQDGDQRPATSDQRPMTGGWPILTLSQGYERGWVAWQIEWPNRLRNTHSGKPEWVTNLILSWLPRVTRLEHVRVDGWKNGFVLRQDSGQVQDKFSDEWVVIFYWPQLLEWVGLLGLIGVGIWIWRAPK